MVREEAQLSEMSASLARRLALAEGGDTVVAAVPWRSPPTLVGASIGAALVRAVFQGGVDAIGSFEIRRQLMALASLDDDPVFADSLALALPEGLRTVPVNLRNTQFVGTDRRCNLFKWGYELETLALIDALVADDGHYMDVGSNFGYFPLHLAARPGFAGKVTAFEPAPGPFEDMRGLVEAFGLADRIDLRPLGLSDAARAAKLNDDEWSGGAKVTENGLGPDIELARLDDLGLAPASFIKLDVEYHEAAALSGASTYLRLHRPWVLFEMHNDQVGADYWRPVEILDGLGYKFAFARGEAVFDGDPDTPRWIRLSLTVGGPPGPGAGPAFYNMLAFPGD